MRVSLVVPVLLLLCAGRLAAQGAPPVEVAAGYAFMHDEDSSYNFRSGWMVSLAAHAIGCVDAVADAGGSYKTLSIPGDPPKFTVYSFMGGPRFRIARIGPFAPFAQMLFGVARATTKVVAVSETASDFAYQPGAGLDVMLQRHLGARVAWDYRIVRAEARNSRESRVVVAAVFGIGR